MTEKSDQEKLEQALGELPIFPLPHVVLFPRALLPLHVFEPRYRTMLTDCMETHRAMAIALVPDPNDLDEHGHPRIASVAGAGLIIEHHALPDGRANIVLHGRARVRLEELPFIPPYRRARATILKDIPTPIGEADKTALFASASAFISEVAKRDPKFSFNVARSLEPGAFADMCGHHLVVDTAVRQTILEELDLAERVRKVISELAQQHSAMSRESGGFLN
jgi:Lon protease-like protein